MTDATAEPSVKEMVADLAQTVEKQQTVIDQLVERQGILADALQEAALDTDEVEEAVEAAVRAGATDVLGSGDDGDGLEYPEPEDRYFQ